LENHCERSLISAQILVGRRGQTRVIFAEKSKVLMHLAAPNLL